MGARSFAKEKIKKWWQGVGGKGKGMKEDLRCVMHVLALFKKHKNVH